MYVKAYGNFMQDNFPMVSIGVPVYNGVVYLADTLSSIQQQTYSKIELIIVDDCSTDNSYMLCKDLADKSGLVVSVDKNEYNKGVSATCNILLKKANGKYFQLLGQDDILLPGKIEADVQLFEQLPDDTAFIYSKVKLIDKRGELTGEDYFERIGFNGNLHEPVFQELVKKNFIPAPTAMMRTEIVRSVGGYDESLLFEDWDMWLRLAKEYKVVFNDKCNVYYRIHRNSVMANRELNQTIKANEANIKMINKHFGFSSVYDNVLQEKLKSLCIYSYFIGDKKASEKLRSYLTRKFDVKVLFYYLFSSLGLKHPSKIY